MPGTFGSNMAFVMLITLAYILASGEARGWRAIVNFAALDTIGIGLFVSDSRSPLVELIAGALIMFWLRGKIASGLKGSFFIVVGLWIALSSMGVFFLERFQTLLKVETFFWQWFSSLMSGLQIALSNPLGVGLGYTGGGTTLCRQKLGRGPSHWQHRQWNRFGRSRAWDTGSGALSLSAF